MLLGQYTSFVSRNPRLFGEEFAYESNLKSSSDGFHSTLSLLEPFFQMSNPRSEFPADQNVVKVISLGSDFSPIL